MFNISIETGDDAFSTDPAGELEKIVSDITAMMHNGWTQGSVRDTNGNTIGSWSYDPPELEEPVKFTIYARRVSDISMVIDAGDEDDAGAIADGLDANDRRWSESYNDSIEIVEVKEGTDG